MSASGHGDPKRARSGGSRRSPAPDAEPEAVRAAAALAGTIAQPVLLLSAGGEVRMANRAFVERTGVPRGELLGRKVWDTAQRWCDPSALRALLDPLLAGRASSAGPAFLPGPLPPGDRPAGTAEGHEARLRRLPGTRTVSIVLRPVAVAAPAPRPSVPPAAPRAPPSPGTPGVAAMVSHELRDAIGAIALGVQLLGEGKSRDPETTARRVQGRLHELNDMLRELTDAGRILLDEPFSVRQESVAVAPAVATVLSELRPGVEAAGGTLVLEAEPGTAPALVLADPTHLRRILRHLLENAVRHGARPGEAPRVRVRVRVVSTTVEIDVIDEGPGIEPAMHPPALFEPFARGGRARRGFGLGLTLAQHLAGLQRGRIEARAGPGGRGSVFTLRLPAASA